MNILFASNGTYGDIFPLVILATKLKKFGHNVAICSNPNYKKLAEEFNLKYYEIGMNIENALNELLKQNIFSLLIESYKQMQKEVISQLEHLPEILKNYDIIFSSGMIALSSVAEVLGINYRNIFFMPQALESKFHPPMIFSIPLQNLPFFINKILWRINNIYINLPLKKIINSYRKKNKLTKLKNIWMHHQDNAIITTDKYLATIPADVKTKFKQIDYWYFNSKMKLSQGVDDFINNGKPPIYIGFGSMIDANPSQTKNILEKLVSIKENRYIISLGWSNLGINFNFSNVKIIGYEPHDVLFPKMSIIIHHGGSGTTHMAAKCGIPQIIIHHMADQSYWGEIIYRLKLGPKPINRMFLSFKKINNAIIYIQKKPEISKNANKLGQIITMKDSYNDIINYIEKNFIHKDC